MFSVDAFIKTFSYLGVFALIFAESGLLVGLIFPGDSLLFLAGGLASQHVMNIYGLIVVVLVAAITGNLVGYFLGHRFGRKFFNRSKFLTPKELGKAERFFEGHGGKAVTLSRFVPIIRTIVPLLAGMGKMPLTKFMTYSILGAIAWAVTITLMGYYVGSRVPNIDHYVLPVLAAVIVLSMIPPLWRLWQTRKAAPSPKQG